MQINCFGPEGKTGISITGKPGRRMTPDIIRNASGFPAKPRLPGIYLLQTPDCAGLIVPRQPRSATTRGVPVVPAGCKERVDMVPPVSGSGRVPAPCPANPGSPPGKVPVGLHEQAGSSCHR